MTLDQIYDSISKNISKQGKYWNYFDLISLRYSAVEMGFDIFCKNRDNGLFLLLHISIIDGENELNMGLRSIVLRPSLTEDLIEGAFEEII